MHAAQIVMRDVQTDSRNVAIQAFAKTVAEARKPLRRHTKWLRGIRWDEIDANRVLRHVTSWGQSEVEIDLKEAPMVMQELGDVEWPKHGPIILAEATGKPWVGVEFRRLWRVAARAAGVPDNVKNMHVRFS
jgi:hypothetical protein